MSMFIYFRSISLRFDLINFIRRTLRFFAKNIFYYITLDVKMKLIYS